MTPRATALQAADSPPDSPAPSPHRAPLSLLLGLLSSVGAFTIDAYFPSMRAIAQEFHLSAWQVQQTLTVYMFTYAFAAAPNFATLLAFRAVQGVVAGGGQIIGRAIVLDHWQLDETMFAALNLPIICGYCIGAVASGRLAGRVPPQRQARFGFQLLLIVTALMLLQSSLASPPIYLQQLLLALIGFALQLMYPIVTLRVLDLFPDARGAAASMQSFFSLFIATITMGLVAPLLAPSMIRIALVSVTAASAAGLLWWLAQRYRAAHAQLHG